MFMITSISFYSQSFFRNGLKYFQKCLFALAVEFKPSLKPVRLNYYLLWMSWIYIHLAENAQMVS